MSFSFLFELSKRDFIEKYKGSILGIWWAFIWPAINIFIYTVIFSKIMSIKISGVSSTYSYGIYIASGLIPWITFSNTLIRASNIFSEKRHIISKVPVNLLYFPVSIALSETITFFISLSIFIFITVLLGVYPNKYIFLLPIAYFFMQLFALSISIVFASLNVFIKDIFQMVNIVIQLWFWLTPIVYTIDILPEKVKSIIIYNPVYAFIQAFQKTFIPSLSVNVNVFTIYCVLSIIMFILSYTLYKKLYPHIKDELC